MLKPVENDTSQVPQRSQTELYMFNVNTYRIPGVSFTVKTEFLESALEVNVLQHTTDSNSAASGVDIFQQKQQNTCSISWAKHFHWR